MNSEIIVDHMPRLFLTELLNCENLSEIKLRTSIGKIQTSKYF